jgi:transposase
MSINGASVMAATVVAVDVGKNTAALSVTDAARHRLLGPINFAMTAVAVSAMLDRVCGVLPAAAAVKVGIEAAGHYHRPLLAAGVWPAGWEVLELSPARVSEQRRVLGRRRVKTDAIDLAAITELVLAGHGVPVTARMATVIDLTGWAMQRNRRVQTRTAIKNQLLSQLDRCFPGVTLALPDVLGTRIGCLVAAEFADPQRLAALGVTRFVRFAANRGLRVRRSAADRLVAAARAALPTPEGAVARQVLADDLGLLADLDAQIAAAEAKIAQLLPETPFTPLLTVPGWGVVRAANYGAAVGDPGRWPGARQLYRASGLSPAQYESAGKRRDGSISREGSVALRRALIDLGIGLWRSDPSARRYGLQLRARGKKGGVIGCAMANRANRIAYALVRDQTGYEPGRWA